MSGSPLAHSPRRDGPFDVALVMEEQDAEAAGEVVVDLTQSFGESSTKRVAAHLRSQQDQMCEDVVKDVEQCVRPAAPAPRPQPAPADPSLTRAGAGCWCRWGS